MSRREFDGSERSVSEPDPDLLCHLTSIALAEASRSGLKRQDAEEIAQKSLMRYCEYSKSAEKPQAYVRVVTRRLSRELLRSQAVAAKTFEHLQTLSLSQLNLGRSDRLRDLRFAVRKLQPNERELFQMLAAGLSSHEIAQQLGCLEGAARMRVHRLREKLRLQM